MAIIVRETNNEIQRLRDTLPPEYVNNPKITYLGDTNLAEIAALIGLIYYRGLLGLAMHKTEVLFSEEFGHPVFSATMSKNRFKFLIARLRFDDRDTRRQRFHSDRFAAFR